MLLVAALCASAPARAKKTPYVRGETVVFTGTVTDGAGDPVADLEVVLEASRHSYDYLRFKRRTPVTRETRSSTSSDGSFEIRWPWAKGFNRFELHFGITVAGPGGGTFHVLHKEDLSKRIHLGSPVVTTAQIEDTSFLESFRDFLAGLVTADQERVYREAGKPDKVRERVSATHTEIDWWYFDFGKVYRFRDGKLIEVEDFTPLEPFDS